MEVSGCLVALALGKLGMTDEERVHRGARAKECLDNEEFQAAFTAIEEDLTNAWKTSPQRDAEGRERVFLALTMLSKVRSAIVQTMETGKLAAEELKYKKTLADRVKEWAGTSL